MMNTSKLTNAGQCQHENKRDGRALMDTWDHVPRGHCQGPHNARAVVVGAIKCTDCGKSWRA